MLKHTYQDKASKQKMIDGINKLANLVGVTLGAQGRNVVIETSLGEPQITKDGVTVSSNVNLINPLERLGANMVKHAAEKTAYNAGDGTTSSIVLAQSFINGYQKLLDEQDSRKDTDQSSKISPIEIKETMDKLTDEVLELIDKYAIQIDPKDTQMLKWVATISANNDKVLGDMIGDTYAKVGTKGAILVEEWSAPYTQVQEIEGIQFDNGYVSNKFITDEMTQSCTLENCHILLTNRKISRFDELKDNILIPLAERSIEENKNHSLLIVADDLEAPVLNTLILNKNAGKLNICVVKGPSYSENRRKILEDMSLIVDGQFCSQDSNYSVADLDMDSLGYCDKAVITAQTFTLIKPRGIEENKELIQRRIEIIEHEKETATTEWEVNRIDERIARLCAKMAIIKVGGVTQLQVKETKDRLDDAIKATKCALLEGVLPGGGSFLLRASRNLITVNDLSKPYSMALESLFLKMLNLISTAESKNKDIYLLNLDSGEMTSNDIFNFKTKKMENAFDNGIFDPAKVIKEVVRNASAVASAVIMTEGIIHDDIDVTEFKQQNQQFKGQNLMPE
jgi:chaperonin GroEL